MKHHASTFSNKQLANAVQHWKYLEPVLTYSTSKKAYLSYVSHLDELLDVIGDDEKHPLMGLADLFSHFITEYEEKHLNKIKSKGVDALKYLMKAHKLRQSDFPEIASQGVMSEILNSKRKLSVRQIKLLAKRFKVSPETFID